MRSPIVVFLTALLMATLPWSAAFADTKCKRRADKQIAKFDSEVANSQQRFQGVWAERADGYLGSVSDPADRERLSREFAQLEAEYDFNAFLAQSRQLKSEMRAATAPDAQGPCKIDRRTDTFFDNTLDGLDELEEAALEALDDRIAIQSVGPKEGLVVLAMYIDGPMMRLTLDKRGSMTGARAFNNLPQGQFFRVIKLPAGEYQWTTMRFRRELTRNYWADSTTYYFDFRDAELAFRVEPGKLNFTGVLMYSARGNYAEADIKDRSSIVMRLMENRHPDLLAKYPSFNGAVPDDSYLQFFLDERRALQEAAP